MYSVTGRTTSSTLFFFADAGCETEKDDSFPPRQFTFPITGLNVFARITSLI